MPLTEAQHQIRRQILTASDVGAVMGMNPWKSPLEVYLEKVSTDPPWVGNYATRRGDALEPLLLEWLGERLAKHDLAVERRGSVTLVDPVLPRLGATLDGVVLFRGAPVGVAEAKTSAVPTEWRDEDGAWKVPDWYQAQVQAQMLVARLPVAHVVADIAGEREPVILKVKADRDMQTAIAETAQIFMEEHVDAREPPDLEKESYERITRLYPRPLYEGYEQAPPDIEAMAREYLALQEGAGALREEAEILRARIAAATGDRAGWKGEGWRLQWRFQEATDVAFRREAGRVFDLRRVKTKQSAGTRGKKKAA